MATPPLGWIAPRDRTREQNAAHARALALMPRFAPGTMANPTGPVKVILTDVWKHPTCVADTGMEFTGFGQYTGSCVGVSEGNVICTLAGIQRLLTQGATKAFIPWWPFPYGRTRYNEGDRGQGEGAVDSVMGETLAKEGVFDINQPNLPQFSQTGSDGFWLTKQLEYQWSDGGSSVVTQWKDIAAQHTLGTHAPLATTEDIRLSIINGYPVIDGCDYYVGNGKIKGSGDNAYTVGHYDGRGGHSTCILGVWDHPNDGRLFLYSNQWQTSTYPKDPAGGGRCTVWLPEAEMAKLFHTGGSDGETMACSHLNWFPAQPDLPTVLDAWI